MGHVSQGARNWGAEKQIAVFSVALRLYGSVEASSAVLPKNVAPTYEQTKRGHSTFRQKVECPLCLRPFVYAAGVWKLGRVGALRTNTIR